ncbi:hypothetical protein Hanom_Chr01g00006441 [Helianthus anomalus]
MAFLPPAATNRRFRSPSTVKIIFQQHPFTAIHKPRFPCCFGFIIEFHQHKLYLLYL